MKFLLKLAAGLSSGGLLSVIDGALTLVNGLVKMARDKGLVDKGRQLQLADNLREIARTAGIARQIEAETDAMGPDQILRDLDGHGEFRD